MSGCECLISGAKTNSRGVAIFLKNNFEYKLIKSAGDDKGNLTYVDINIGLVCLRLINIYAPNLESPSFFERLNQLIEENTMDHLIICDDFNVVLNPEMDCSNYLNINNPKRQVLLETINSHNLIDVFRYFHPDTQRYKNPIKQARLDYFIVSSPFTDHISKCNIMASYRSDHSILEINIQISKFERSKGLWKLNCNLLKNAVYIDLINKTIHKVKFCLQN